MHANNIKVAITSQKTEEPKKMVYPENLQHGDQRIW